MSNSITPHDPDLIRGIQMADGYRLLGMHDDAWTTLDELAAEHQGMAVINIMRMEIQNARKRYLEAASLAEALLARNWREDVVFLSGAYAIRRGRSVEEAERFLLSGDDILKESAIYHFNLGCYACVQGNLDMARERLKKAFALDRKYRDLARQDEDLRPLWCEL